MVRVQYTKILSASSERVWSAFTDYASWPVWTSVIRGVDGNGEFTNGTSLRTRFTRGPLSSVTLFLNDIETNKSFSLYGKAGGISVCIRFILQPIGEQTKLSIVLEYGGIMMSITTMFGSPHSIEDLAALWVGDIEKRCLVLKQEQQ